ncbi:HvfC/BufC N-terminal domain-containing protein [Legionella maioricensis]|uniref:DNA-binding domain-containing protein n=1 Tax=Legionella maioricensis TaxID=2896528 RepID=A0A9X2D1L8_9GAMM|nr:putative DNA-binding domain-containing protein [Legionella maioricensis]MCL9684689.1 DNA-binding domain-containing protein [Legionella maioricensis]MCL9687717.1 DNA-binding domain-containing protein [Legionella maioricensis]
MTELPHTQEQFQKFIFSGQSEINDSIVQTERVSVDTRLAIYRDAYKLRLIESLTTTFPAVHAYLGTEAFEEVCNSYIDAHPSSYRSIRWFGDVLAEFLQNYYAKKYSFLAELADFEWKMTLAFDAADKSVLHIADMANVPPESWAGMKFTLHPSVQRVNYFWNAIPLWQTLINDHELPELENASVATSWILWRSPDYIIQFYSLSEEEAWAIDALIQGLSFGQLCEGLCQWINAEEVGLRAASYLKNWIQNGMVSELCL